MGSRRGGRADQARRDDLPRRQHRVRQRARALRRRWPASTSRASSTRPTRQPFSHIHRPGRRRRRPLHPRLPALLPRVATPTRALPAAAREVNEAMPAYAVDLLGRRSTAAWPAARAHPRRRLPRRRQGDGVLRRVRAARRAGAARRARRSPPTRCTTTTSCAALGFAPWDGGAGRRARSSRPTTRSTAALAPADLPGARAVVDGRGVLDPRRFAAAGVDAAPHRASAGRSARQRSERRDDALARAAVAVELRAARRAACARARPAPRSRVEVDEHVPARLDRLDPLGRVAQRHARHARRGRPPSARRRSRSASRARAHSSAVNAR